MSNPNPLNDEDLRVQRERFGVSLPLFSMPR